MTAGGGVDKYIASSFSTVLIISIDGKHSFTVLDQCSSASSTAIVTTVLFLVGKEYTKEQSKIEAQVEKKVKDVVNKLKASHGKFEDPDFGPNEKDEYGAISFYGDAPPAPAGSKYPKPETLRWERPQYRDDKFVAGGGGGGDGPDEAAEVVEEGEEEEEDDEFGFGGDDEEDEMDIWCKHGSLFIDGSSSGDVIQVLPLP